jgi:hypothetical protein
VLHSETAPLILEKEGAPEKSKSPAPGAPAEELEFIVRHASGKQLSEEQVAETRQYTKDLKYPQGSLVYNNNDEDDFLYCLPDNKEISVCQEMMKNMMYPKLELDLSAMSKDDCNTPSNPWTNGTYSWQLSRIIYRPHKPT